MLNSNSAQMPKQHSHHHHQHQQQQQPNQDLAEARTLPTPPNSLPQPLNKSYTATKASVATDESDTDYPDARYECAICIHWLNEPVVTSCGHRFCKSCLNDWLLNHNQCCPLDNKMLSTERDIFPDNYTRREIEQIKFKCPNSPLGCAVVASPIEVDRHLPTCPYRRQPVHAAEKCPFASIKCDFVGRPETNALEEHLKDNMPHHMQLMLQAFQQTAVATWNPQKPTAQTNGSGGAMPPPPPQYANEADEQLIQAMYQRIVVLEQRAREQDVEVENLCRQLTHNRQQDQARYSNGTIVWQISNFRLMVNQMRANANSLFYSNECYTSPYGYKFCARVNIQPKKDNLLSLHVHLMQSENDCHLDWPFKGRIKLCMIHPRDANLSQHDTIMTKPEILAFHQPQERISTRGFGFVEYASITDILQKGFCEGDRLLIKIQINIV